MALTLELDPETEARVNAVAAAAGVPVASFLREAVEAQLERSSAPPASLTDLDLLERINRGLPVEFWERYRELKRRRD